MMKSKKLISAILAAASIAGGVVGAQAQTVEGLESKVDSYTSRVQQAESKIQDLQTKVNALDTTGIADNKAQIEANKKDIGAISGQLKNLDKNADKQHWQIDALEKKTGVNTPLSNGATNLSAGVNENTRKIDAEATARENAVNGLQSQVTTQGAQITQLQKDMAQNTIDHVNDVNNINTKLDQKAAKADVEANKNDIASNAAAIKKETQKREDAVNGLQNQVTVASGRIDNLKNQVTENKGAIEKLQTQWNDSNRAFNAEQVNKIDTNKNDIETIFGQLDQGAYNKADGYVVKKDDTIGGALKNLDKNADKQHWQIEALEKKTGINTPLTNGAGNLSAGVNENTRKIDAETDDRIDADNKLSGRIDANKTAIENEATARKDEDTKLQTQISQNQKNIEKNGFKADTALKVAGNGVLYNHATNLTDGVNENTKKIDANVKDIAANKTAIENEATARKDEDTKLQNNINAEATIRENAVNALNSRIDQLGSDANKGIAKASALAALHPLDYDPDNKFDIAAAGGFYKGENAFALGAFYRPNRNVMLSMGTTLTDGDNAYNVGLTFKIGKSGKHTEAGLTTADLYAMIGAMQDKMDQQQKKIEELEAKQAK